MVWRDNGYDKWKKEQEEKQKRGEVNRSPRNPIQYTNPTYRGESETRKTSYQWEKDILKDLPIKRYGRSYNDKFDRWTREQGINPSEAREFRRWLDSQEDEVETTSAATDRIISGLTSPDKLKDFRKRLEENRVKSRDTVNTPQPQVDDTERSGLLGFLDRFVAPISKGATEAFIPGNTQMMAQTDPNNPIVKAMQKDRGLETTALNTAGILTAFAAPYSQAYKAADVAFNKIPSLARIANPYAQKAVKGAMAGGMAEGGVSAVNELANPDAKDMRDYALQTGLGIAGGAVLDPALHGIYNIVKGLRGARGVTNNAVTQQAEELLALPAPRPEPLGLPEPQIRLPEPNRVNHSLETFNNAFRQPRGLQSPIPEMPDVMRIAANRNRMQQAGVDFGFNTKNTPKARPDYSPVQPKAEPLDPLNRSQSYWQDRYESFARYVNKNYDMNQMTPEALEDLWSQFARYDEPVRLEQAVDLAYPKGFEAPPVPKEVQGPREPNLKDALRADERINEKVRELFPPIQPEPRISRPATLDEMFRHMEDLAPPKQPEPSMEPLRFSRPQESLVGQHGKLPKGFENIARRNQPIQPEQPSLNRLKRENLRPGRDFEAIESRDRGGRLIQVPEVDRTPINVPNAKEIVKRQINVDGKREKSKWSFDKFYTAVIDDLKPLDKATRELGGKDLSFENNPYTQARLARGVEGKAETYLRGGIYNEQGQKVGKALEEIIKPIEKKMDDFLAYATSKRALDYDEKSLTAGIKPKDVEGMSERQLADAAIRQLEAESPEFAQVHQELVQYNNRLMDELVDAGVLDKDTVLSLREDNPNYIPMFRVQEPRVRGFQPLSNPKNRYANLGEPIKKRTGSEREIINPVESIIKNTYLTLNMAERNRVGNSLFELIEGAGDNAWGRVVGKGKGLSMDDIGRSLDEANAQLNDGASDAIDNLFKGEGNKVYVYQNGQKVEMELQEDLYKAMLSLDAQKQNFFIEMLSVPTRMLRTGAVLSPDFGPVNIVRDQFSAYINSKYGFKPFVDMFSGLANVLKEDDVYWSWKNSGGANSVLSTLDREYLQQDLRRMVKQSLWSNVKDRAKHPLRTMLEPLRKVSEITEEATRLGEFKKGLKKGATHREAAFSSRDLIDFSRAGTHGRQYNQVTAFFNAAVQSVDKLARTFKENPKGATVRALTGITLPSVVAYMYSHDKEWYKEIPQRDRDLFWHFEVDDQIYKLPKPFEAGVLFGTVPERTLDALKTQDPEAFDGLGKALFQAFTPSWIPTALLPWIEVYANRSTYFDSPIVPRREQDLLPEDQYGPYQSELSKGFGALTKTSPRKAEHVFRGYTGGLGKYGLQISDMVAEATGTERPDMPDRGLADLPIVNRFVVKNLEGNNQSVDDFYTRMDQLRRENLSAKKHNPSHENTGDFKRINKLSREISELQAEKRDIIADMHMDGKEKARRIKSIDSKITEIAKRGKNL